METLYYAAPIFLPLISFLLAGLFGNQLGNRGVNILTCGLLFISAALAADIFYSVAFLGNTTTIELLPWVSSGELQFSWALRFDTLSAVMVFVVCSVSALVHLYSVGYMRGDASISRFMGYLGLFTFAMLMLVTADNLVQMFFGWEGVGLASYLLIGFWHEKDSANEASMKAFIVNRVGDFGFTLGIFGIFLLFGTVAFDPIFLNVESKALMSLEFLGVNLPALDIICLLLFVGAMGKSAQLGLHTWLPDAMEGPTPVSALIHAATMVTAGIFMVVRLSPLFEYAPNILDFIAILGALTALVAASIGLVQNDIKRVIAYSTMSQLGYMFFAIGVSAYSAAMFHLFTHAFFKALLFLGAGSVIHAMHHEQDMRKMGGLWKKIPFTYVMMWIGSLALAGIPLFAGYFSKDMILEAAYAAHTEVGEIAYWIGITAAFMTAFYSWRLLYMTFHGAPRMTKKAYSHVHESPLSMTIPLFVLAVGAVFAGYVFYDYFVGHERGHFWASTIFVMAGRDAVEAAHHVPLWVKKAPLVVSGLGILLATIMYIWIKGLPERLATSLQGIYRTLLNKYYIDELYDAVFVRASTRLGRVLWHRGDEQTIDRFGPNGFSSFAQKMAGVLSKIQSGLVYHYAFAMMIGIVVFLSYVVFMVKV